MEQSTIYTGVRKNAHCKCRSLATKQNTDIWPLIQFQSVLPVFLNKIYVYHFLDRQFFFPFFFCEVMVHQKYYGLRNNKQCRQYCKWKTKWLLTGKMLGEIKINETLEIVTSSTIAGGQVNCCSLCVCLPLPLPQIPINF